MLGTKDEARAALPVFTMINIVRSRREEHRPPFKSSVTLYIAFVDFVSQRNDSIDRIRNQDMIRPLGHKVSVFARLGV